MDTGLVRQFAAETAHSAEAAQPSGIAALGIAPGTIALQLLTFLVLFVVIKRFALEKIVAILERRRQTIEDGIRLGRAMEAEKATLQEKVEQTLRQARSDADALLAAAREEAGGIVRQAEIDAQAKISSMMAEAQRTLDADIEAAKAGMRQELASLVADATATVLRAKLDESTDAALIQQALTEAQRGS